MPSQRFRTAEDYLKQSHPQYAFVFPLGAYSERWWGYAPERAKELQSDIIPVVCAHAGSHGAAKGLEIIIGDYRG